MKAKNQIVIFMAFIVVMFLNYCMQNDYEKISGNLNKNFIIKEPDSVGILKSLMGEWIWDSSFCEKKGTYLYAGYQYRIKFTNNFSLQVFRNGEIIQSGIWHLNKDSFNYLIETRPYIENICGAISLNNNCLHIKNRSNDYDCFYSHK
jgi:hypothetical protein